MEVQVEEEENWLTLTLLYNKKGAFSAFFIF